MPPISQNKESELQGIGGWLLAVLFLLIVNIPLVTVLNTYFFFMRPPDLYVMAQILGISDIVLNIRFFKLSVCFSLVIASLVSGYRLLKVRHWSSVVVSIHLMIACYFISLLAIYQQSKFITRGFGRANLASQLLDPYMQNMVFFAAIAVYLYSSKRVKNVYPREKEVPELHDL